MGKLNTILKQAEYSVFREKLFEHKFQYELKLYSALNNPNIEVFLPEIDKDGFDIVIHDSIELRRIQLKTILKDSKTQSWEIKKNLIRPKEDKCGLLNFECSPEGSGVGGAFILIVGDTTNDDLKFESMYYSDAYLLSLFEHSILCHRNQTHQNVVLNCLNHFKKVDNGQEKKDRDIKVEVTKSSMVKFDNLSSVFSFSNFPGVGGSNWIPLFEEFVSKKSPEARAELVKELKLIIRDPRIIIQ